LNSDAVIGYFLSSSSHNRPPFYGVILIIVGEWAERSFSAEENETGYDAIWDGVAKDNHPRKENTAYG
jgi:hypothetical protein